MAILHPVFCQTSPSEESQALAASYCRKEVVITYKREARQMTIATPAILSSVVSKRSFRGLLSAHLKMTGVSVLHFKRHDRLEPILRAWMLLMILRDHPVNHAKKACFNMVLSCQHRNLSALMAMLKCDLRKSH
jgi:hypothetical protein